MKDDGLLRQNWLKGKAGDALHTVLCGAGHNIRILLRRISFYWLELWTWLSAPLANPKSLSRGLLSYLMSPPLENRIVQHRLNSLADCEMEREYRGAKNSQELSASNKIIALMLGSI